MKAFAKLSIDIADEEFNKLNKLPDSVDRQEFRQNVARRLRELDLNNYSDELAEQKCSTYEHSKTKPYPSLAQMLLPTFTKEELDSAGFASGKKFPTHAKVKIEDLNFRYNRQFDHAAASMKEAANTKEMIDSEIGKMMAEDPNLTWWDALERFKAK